MSAQSTAVVEQLLDRVGRQRWDELPPLLTDDYEIVEPDSLPYGGTHRGVDGYVALMQRIGSLFALRFDVGRIERVGEDGALLRMDVTFTSHATGRSVALPVVELLTLRGERIARSEMQFCAGAGPSQVHFCFSGALSSADSVTRKSPATSLAPNSSPHTFVSAATFATALSTAL
jgi:ketosteroid isomerase-like protein